MPTLLLPLPEIQESIVRPAVFDIIAQLKKTTGINFPTPIYFPGDLKKMHQAGTTIDNANKDPVLSSQRQIFVEVSETYNEDYVASIGALYANEHPPVFLDPILHVKMVPVYVTTTLKIDLKFKTQSKTEALRWRDDILVQMSRLRNLNPHDITYHFSIPGEFLEILKHIHTLREQTEGYGQAFQDYIVSNGTTRLKLIADQANKFNGLAVSEKQCKIFGLYDFDVAPENAERDDASGTWISTMSYNVSYQRPTEMSMQYPIMVHNELLPEKYVTYVLDNPTLDNRVQRYSTSIFALSSFETPNYLESIMDLKPFINVPEFDQFNPKQVPTFTGCVFMALCRLDLPDKKTLMNLNEVDPIVIDEDIIEFIRESEYPYIGRLYQSVIQIHLYKDDKLFIYNDGDYTGGEMAYYRDGGLICSPDLTISTRVDLNPRRTHRVRFSLVTDLALLQPEAFYRLKKYPKAFDKIMRAILEIFRDNPGDPRIGKKLYQATIDELRINQKCRKTIALSWVISTKKPNP